MEQENELNIKISATMQKALDSINKVIPKLNETDNVVKRVLTHFDSAGNLSGFTTELKKMNSEFDNTIKKSKNLVNALNLAVIFKTTSKIVDTGLSWMKYSIDYSEALNLFNVVLDKSVDKATKFQNVMNEAFGTNQETTLTYQGLFHSMAENMGIGEKYAYIMSEASSKLVNDISSLYNKNEKDVAEALRAGIYAGQTKPLRSYGMDVTQQTLQPLLDEFGLKNEDGSAKTVRQLSQAEKQILRYIAVLRQSSVAHGDFANTVESPANQLKVFSNQLIEAQKSLSNLFVGAFSKILPYANAFLMVIKEVSKAIGVFFGIEVSDYNSSIASQENAYIDLGDAVDDASDSVKELRRQTLGFDQINNLTEPKDSGSGTNMSNAIDQRLLDALESYDNGMDNIKMKATEIRDKIMEWLGFTKEIDPLTGAVSFKLKEGYTNLEKIWDVIKLLTGLGLISLANKLAKSIGNTGLGKQVKSLYDYVKKYADVSNNGLLKGITSSTRAWFDQQSILTKLTAGVVGAYLSFDTMADVYHKLGSGASVTNEEMGITALKMGGLLTAAGLLAGPLGLVVVGLAGIIGALKGYNDGLEEAQRISNNEKIFDGVGVSLSLLSDKIIESDKDIRDFNTRMGELSKTFSTNSEIIASSSGDFDYFVTKLTETGDLTDEEINSMVESAKKVREAVNENFHTATRGIFETFKSTVSDVAVSLDVDVEKMTNTLFAFEKAFGEQTSSIEKELGELEEKIYNGTATKDDFNRWVELQGTYADLKFNIDDTALSLDKLLDKIKTGEIDWGSSPEEAVASIQKISDEYVSLVDGLDTSKREAEQYVDYLMKMIPTLFKDPATQQQMKTAIEEYKTNITNSFELKEQEVSAKFANIKTLLQGQWDAVYGSLKEQQETSLGDWWNSFWDHAWSANGSELPKEKALQRLEEQYSGVTGALNNLGKKSGKSLVDGVSSGVYDNVKLTDDAVMKITDSMSLGANDREKIRKSYYDAGVYTVGGLIKAMEDNYQLPIDQMTTLSYGMAKAIWEYFDIHSPSGLTEKYGIAIDDGLIKGISSKKKNVIDEVNNMMKDIEKEFKTKVFNIDITADNLDNTFNSILNKLEQFTNKFRDGVNSMLTKFSASMNNIKIGSDGKVTYTSMPYISIPKFENGGLPPMGQLFMANEAGPELVGQIGTKTAVANNDQIVDGIKAGVYEGVTMAMANGGQAVNVNINARTEKGTIVETVVEGINDFIISNGDLPFPVPIR